MEQCRTNLKQFRTTLRTGRTTWNNRQKFNLCERRFRQAKKAFFSENNNGIQLIISKNIQNYQNDLEQTAKVSFSQNREPAQESVFFKSHCSGFYFKNLMLWNNVEQTQNTSEQLSEQVEQPGTTGKSSIFVKEGFARPKQHFSFVLQYYD